ncbi:MAG: type II secretion system protein [Rickettsiales bacterium]
MRRSLPLCVKRARAFSLVELSVVLMIIGVTLIGALDLSINHEESERADVTRTRMARIERALDDYVLTYKRMPCPAASAAKADDPHYGEGGAPPTPGAQSCPNAVFNDGSVYMGMPPVKDLGLSEDDALDGWDRRMFYAVDVRFSYDETLNPACAADKNCFFYAKNGAIAIRNVEGSELAGDAVYALFSAGSNGYGAYNAVGAIGASSGRLEDPPTSHEAERDNAATLQSAAVTFDATFVQNERSDVFDDILSYRPKWRITGDAGGMEPEDWSVCTSASNPNGTCAGASDVNACTSMASAAYAFCLDDNG